MSSEMTAKTRTRSAVDDPKELEAGARRMSGRKFLTAIRECHFAGRGNHANEGMRLFRMPEKLFGYLLHLFGERMTLPFHDLQIYRDGRTHGTGGKDVSLETRGIGEATVLVWLRERTYSTEKLIKLEP